MIKRHKFQTIADTVKLSLGLQSYFLTSTSQVVQAIHISQSKIKYKGVIERVGTIYWIKNWEEFRKYAKACIIIGGWTNQVPRMNLKVDLWHVAYNVLMKKGLKRTGLCVKHVIKCNLGSRMDLLSEVAWTSSTELHELSHEVLVVNYVPWNIWWFVDL